MDRSFLTTCLWAAAFTASAAPSPSESHPAVGLWNFDGNLSDRSGRGSDAFSPAPSFVPGHAGQGLKCEGKPAVVPDSPELRPAPGLRIECRARIDAPGNSWQPLLIKEGAYQLRLDPPSEGGHFSFFLDLDGWEPRVRSPRPAKIGAWQHLVAGWDGREIWIEVDGQRTSQARSGAPRLLGEPLELGLFHGVLDELRIENPAAPGTGVGHWLFEGNLRDTSGRGLDLEGKEPRFAQVPGGQAFRSGSGTIRTASRPELQLSPGLRIDCSVFFEQVPTETRPIVLKDGEYQLRANSPAEGGGFAFFVNLGGWEPRVSSKAGIEPGRWYRLTALWDGVSLILDVNGVRSRINRSGLPRPTANPLVAGGVAGLIDNLKLENPRLPALQVRTARQEHAILCAGRPEKLVTTLWNAGTAADSVRVEIKPPPGVRCAAAPALDLGPMAPGTEKTIEWTVQADAPVVGAAELAVTATGCPPLKARHPLVFFASEDAVPPAAADSLGAAAAGSTGPAAATYYIDSAGGSNANPGTSPEAAWRDFTPVNGRKLGPGERLLLRRGGVWNQELALSARGTAGNWAEIGAYGEGPRPVIRRNQDIGERCALVSNPDHLRIRGLRFCRAGKGLVVNFTETGHRGLLIEDCVAHHIEGLYRHNSHGIPEWQDREGADGDALRGSAGIAIVGAPASGLVMRECDTFQNSSGFFVQGQDVLVERVFCHDNIVHNTSPHPFLVNVRRAVLRDCVFDASGWHASAGTMGIMLGDPQGLIIRNCWFRNQPDSGSHDEGGIDFENRGNGCLIDRCTFENNAGAAIEVLGLKTPQTTNIEIRDSRFIRNNTAKKLGPAEIFIWGRVRDPSVCCSTGLVRGNGYLTLPGVEFFVNEAPALTSWEVRDNTRYGSVEEIERAMPFNRPPRVEAGVDIHTGGFTVPLRGRVEDDAKPAGGKLQTRWEVLEGPSPASFRNPADPETAATFEAPGDYTLRLQATDGEFLISDRVVVHVLPEGTSVAAAWEFNTNLDKEGWTEVDPGTQVRNWPNQDWPTTSHPVKLVTGGFYVLAVENSGGAHLLSPGPLGLPLTGREAVVLRLQNHTPATHMRLRFITDTDSAWDEAKSVSFDVQPQDNECHTYTVEMAGSPAWKGSLRQLRLDLATGTPLTGTCRIDFIRMDRLTAP